MPYPKFLFDYTLNVMYIESVVSNDLCYFDALSELLQD